MNFKTVHGLGREEYAIKALNTAMDKGLPPYHVDAWLKWFDAQPEDNHAALGEFTSAARDFLGGVKQCHQCEHGVACPDDCPQPEFYVGDLEEVAHAMVKRIDDAMYEAARRLTPNGASDAMPYWYTALMDGIRAEIATPGYVEALLPE